MIVQVDSSEVGSVASAPKEMLSFVRKADGTIAVRINFSSLSLMQECWRKVELLILRSLRANLEAPATLFGSAIHKGLEVFYRGERTERILPRNYVEVMSMIGCGAWEPDWAEHLIFRCAHAFMEKASPLSALPAENKRSRNVGVWLLRHYFEQYLTDPFVVLSDSQGPIVERTFTMPLHQEPGLTIEAFGTIDVVLKNEVTGVILPCDHKTTTQLGPQFYQRLKPNHQYSFYAWAAREVLGLETDSFLVNAIQVKEMPKTSRGSGPQFARQVTTRTQEDFDELKRAIITSVREFLRHQEDSFFPMAAPGPCSNYGGCQYHDICAAPQSLRENIIQAKYQGRT